MVKNTDHKELIKASAATQPATYAEGSFEVAAEFSSESFATSLQPDTLKPSRPTAEPMDTVEGRPGLSDPDNSEIQGSTCDPPRSRVLHTPLWSRRPLAIRRRGWEVTWWCGSQQDALALSMPTLDAELLAPDVEVEREVVMPSFDTATTIETGTDIEATAERIAPTPSHAAAPIYPAAEGSTKPAIEHLRPHDPSAPGLRRVVRGPPRARVMHTPFYSWRPLGIFRPEWVNTVLANGEQEVLWEAPVHTTSRVAWSHEERMYYFPEDEPKVVARTDSEKHEVA